MADDTEKNIFDDHGTLSWRHKSHSRQIVANRYIIKEKINVPQKRSYHR